MEISIFLQFIEENSEFLEENKIKIFKVVQLLSDEEQLDYFRQIDSINITKEDKLKSVVALHKTVKEQIDREGLATEYVNALDMSLFGLIFKNWHISTIELAKK